jgi:hypothetical protein
MRENGDEGSIEELEEHASVAAGGHARDCASHPGCTMRDATACCLKVQQENMTELRNKSREQRVQ